MKPYRIPLPSVVNTPQTNPSLGLDPIHFGGSIPGYLVWFRILGVGGSDEAISWDLDPWVKWGQTWKKAPLLNSEKHHQLVEQVGHNLYNHTLPNYWVFQWIFWWIVWLLLHVLQGRTWLCPCLSTPDPVVMNFLRQIAVKWWWMIHWQPQYIPPS